MYPADDLDVRLRLLLARLVGMRDRLRQEVERSRALRARVRATMEYDGRPRDRNG